MVAWASPKDATSTPSSLSLVDMSAPVKAPGAAEQRVDDDLGHRVAGRDQAVHPAGRSRALADRPDVRVGGAALLVDQDAAALGDVEAGGTGQRVAGRMPAEKTTTSASTGSASRSASPVTRPSSPSTSWVAAPVWTVRPSASTCRARVAPPASSTCTGISRGAISTTWVSRPRLGQRVGGLEAEQPAADHGAGRRARRGRPDRLEVLDGAVDEAAGRSWPGTGGTNGAAPVASTSSS